MLVYELFEASVNEELYDVERWGQFYRPNNMRNDNANVATVSDTGAAEVVPVKPVSTTAASILDKVGKASTSTTETPVTEAKKQQTPDEIIAAIRARQAKK